jgi:hypothetical protein
VRDEHPQYRLVPAEWNGWEFPGAGDTVERPVFDPNDSPSTAARRHSHGKFDGIPCEVPLVRHLESHYYLVLFYTDTDWTHCNWAAET